MKVYLAVREIDYDYEGIEYTVLRVFDSSIKAMFYLMKVIGKSQHKDKDIEFKGDPVDFCYEGTWGREWHVVEREVVS